MSRAGLVPLLMMHPWSWRAFAVGVLVVAASAALQGVCVLLGADLYFAAFLPGVFVVGILVGAPAAVFAILLSIVLVWWAFMPPFFEFSPLTIAYAHDINLFFLFSVLLIGLADLCRQTVAIIGRGDLNAGNENTAPHSR
ncbi:DUF4118 domain-containing protein [Bradyrhizobium manausense]|uniref:DUF4118 domain-containing protein n=1 Tax=Bradyrhizobium TaxID=374 RepID=UPI001BA9B027|nr:MULTISPECIES: DUF4118 domain-containing protein [Bradyrhizobium]MBR0827354.1 DUF4118 domain-containing protein [Bradyrhizobium manausense]UVO27315.1 DUF4118 domain-containing protein [Bradyrhizobium arachidis]